MPFSILEGVSISFIPFLPLPLILQTYIHSHTHTHTHTFFNKETRLLFYNKRRDNTAGGRKLLIDVLMHLEITYNRSFPELEEEGGYKFGASAMYLNLS